MLASRYAGRPNRRRRDSGFSTSTSSQSWVEANRRRVDSLSDGGVGYVYVPYTFREGFNDFARQLFAQLEKEAVLIDVRWNGGGQPPDRFIDMLDRPALYSTQPRGTPAYREP